MVSAERLCDATRGAELGDVPALVANRERLQAARLPRSERGDQSRIEPATQEDAQRHVRDHPAPHRLLEQAPDLLDEQGLVELPVLGLGRWRPVALDRVLAGFGAPAQ